MSGAIANPEVARDAVVDCLKAIIDPCSAANGTNFNLVEMGILKDIQIQRGDVSIRLRITSPSCMMLEFFSAEIHTRVAALPGVKSVEVHSDGGFEWEPSMMDQQKRRQYLDALRRVLPVLKS
jgi:metal-sulfur cluster biosynthetic enzyme